MSMHDAPAVPPTLQQAMDLVKSDDIAAVFIEPHEELQAGKDPWRSELVYVPAGSRTVIIRSKGPNLTDDGGGGDDIEVSVEFAPARAAAGEPQWLLGSPLRSALLSGRRDYIFCAAAFIAASGGPALPTPHPETLAGWRAHGREVVDWLKAIGPARARALVDGFPAHVDTWSPYYLD